MKSDEYYRNLATYLLEGNYPVPTKDFAELVEILRKKDKKSLDTD